MPKRTREVDNKKNKANQLSIIPIDIWRFIGTFDIYIQLYLSHTCKSFYLLFGSLVDILQNAIIQKNHLLLTNAAKYVGPIECFLHPLCWSKISKHSRFSPLQMIQFEIPNYLSKPKEFKQQYWENDIMIAGGAICALVISAFRKFNVSICSVLTADYGDIDVFVTDFAIMNKSIFGPSIYSNLLTDDKHFSGLSDCRTVQIIKTQTTIGQFDFTPTQVALYGIEWWLNAKVSVTPAFIFSLMTGKMYLNYFASIPWPFENLDSQLIFPCPRYTELENSILERFKISCINRLLKYLKKGYTDILLSSEEIDSMKLLVTNYAYTKPTQEENLDYQLMFEFLDNIFR